MKLNIAIVISALLAFVSLSLADWSCGPACGRSTGPTPVAIPWDHKSINSVGHAKSDNYTCYKNSNVTVKPSDCVAVINEMRAYNRSVDIPYGTCLAWFEGTCMSRICSEGGLALLTVPSKWIADRLSHPLLDTCISNGTYGVTGDCSDMNSTCGSWRIHLEPLGNEIRSGDIARRQRETLTLTPHFTSSTVPTAR